VFISPQIVLVDTGSFVFEIVARESNERKFMKTILVLCGLLVAYTASAQSSNAPAASGGPSAGTQITGTRAETTVGLELAKPNEIVKGDFTLSGILVEAVKTRRPFQLLNPLAPVQYGVPADNIVKDPINGKVTGLKFFCVRF
jgi:hypothetical protein